MSVPTQNDCTGDYLLSKAATDNYRDNYDAIFGKRVKSEAEVVPLKKESKSMNDKMREEFEAWAVSMGFELRGHNGNYLKEIHCAWMAWKASREALVVELPKLSKVEGYHGVEDVWFPEDIIESIQSAGVSVK